MPSVFDAVCVDTATSVRIHWAASSASLISVERTRAVVTLDDVADKRKPSQENRTGTPINIRIDDELMDAVKAYHESLRPRPTFTALVEDALREYLEHRKPRDARPKAR